MKFGFRSDAKLEELEIARRLGITVIERYEYTPAGTGDINWGSVIALLYEAGYTGDLALETHSPFWSDHLEWDLILSKRHIEQFLL